MYLVSHFQISNTTNLLIIAAVVLVADVISILHKQVYIPQRGDTDEMEVASLLSP